MLQRVIALAPVMKETLANGRFCPPPFLNYSICNQVWDKQTPATQPAILFPKTVFEMLYLVNFSVCQLAVISKSL